MSLQGGGGTLSNADAAIEHPEEGTFPDGVNELTSEEYNRETVEIVAGSNQSSELETVAAAADHDRRPSEDAGQPQHDMEKAESLSSKPPIHSAFSPAKKRFLIAMAACAGFFSPLSASIYFPALNPLSADLHVSSGLINLSLTTYMIFQGLAPTFMGDLADTAGRRPAYIIGFTVYIAACIGLALQKNYAALLVLR